MATEWIGGPPEFDRERLERRIAQQRLYFKSNQHEEESSMLNKNKSFPIKLVVILAMIVAILLALLIFNPWKRVVTEAGTQTVVTDTPLFFGKGGVRPEPLQPGSVWIWRTTRTTVVDPKPQVINKSIDDFVSVDNILLDFESTVTVQVTDWPKMLASYGPEWWKNNLERPYNSMVREQVKAYSMKQLMSDTTVATAVDDKLSQGLTAKVAELNMPVRILEISLGRAQPNATILAQMNETATQQQRFLTLEQARLAEGKRSESEKARAEADNAYRNNIGLSVPEFVTLQLADKQIEACKSAKECVILPPGTATVVGR